MKEVNYENNEKYKMPTAIGRKVRTLNAGYRARAQGNARWNVSRHFTGSLEESNQWNYYNINWLGKKWA